MIKFLPQIFGGCRLFLSSRIMLLSAKAFGKENVSGVVTNAQSGLPIPGVTLLRKAPHNEPSRMWMEIPAFWLRRRMYWRFPTLDRQPAEGIQIHTGFEP
jgi:hypothetical protein